MLKLTFGLLLVAAVATARDSSKSVENNSVEVDVPKDPEFCDNREDGLYVTGCSQKFTRCYNKATYSVSCPHNLYYDYLRGQCEYKETVKECQHEKQYRGRVLKTPPDFVCGNRTNGLYAREELPCDRQFFSCDNGIARKMSCPDRQYFDEGKQRCEFPNKISACKSLRLKANGYLPVAPAPEATASYGSLPVSAYGNLPGDAPPAEPQPEDIKAVEVEKKDDEQTVDCHIVGDGVYAALSKCSNHFWKCANDRIFKYECQKNLFYDSEITRCDHKEFIPECGGTRPETTPIPENSAPIKIDFDCTGKDDGYHTKAVCAPEFFPCVGGVAIGKNDCPNGLVYDIRVKQCDYPELCKGELTTPEPPVVGAHGNAVVVESKPAVTQPPFNFDCKEKSDGTYPTGKCVTEYAVCSSGAAYRYQCPGELVFDETNGKCDYKAACIIEKPTVIVTTVPVTSAPVYTQPAVTGYGIPSENEVVRPQIQTYPVSYGGSPVEPETPAPTPAKNPYLPPVATTTKSAPTAAAQPVKPPVNNAFCTDKKNGDHPWKSCSPEYVSCWDGIASRTACYHQLYFNPENGQCDYKENVEGCTGIKKIRPTTTVAPVTAPPAPEQAVSGYGIPIQQDRPLPVWTTTTTTAAPVPRNTFCNNKEDGTYSDGCKSYFYVCIEKRTRKMYCGGQLFYNAAERRCDHKELVPECGATTTTTTTTTQATPVQTPGGYGFPAQDKPSVAVEKPYPFCERLEDGAYGEGCEAHYYNCVDRTTYRMNCPAGLFYSVGVHRCDLKENIDECGGNTPKTTTPAPQVITTPAAPFNPYGRQPIDTPAEPTKPTKASFDCSGKKDGLYDLPECSASFVQCYQGAKYDHECAGGLFYNVANGMCDYKENVVVCGGSLPTTTVAPVSQPQPPVYVQPTQPATGPYGQVVQPATPAQPTETKPNFNCANKKDGFYNQDCSRKYYSCSSGAPTEHTCPTTNVRFSQVLMRCDLPDNVPECGGTAPTVPPTPEGAGAQPEQPQLPTFDCSKMPDGYHAFKTCSSHYVVCQSGSALIGTCQNGLIYNLQSGQCQYKENVAECNPQQTQPTPAPTMPAVPSVEPTVAVLPPNPKDKCANLADGHYVISACAASFMICKNGVSSTQFCPQGQIVNHKTGKCDQPQNVAGCSSSVPVGPVAPVQPGYGVQTPVVQQPNYGYQAPVAQQPSYGYQAPVAQQPPSYGYQAPVAQQQPSYEYQAPTQNIYVPAPPAQTGYGMSQQAPVMQQYGPAPAPQQYGGYQQWRPQEYGK